MADEKEIVPSNQFEEIKRLYTIWYSLPKERVFTIEELKNFSDEEIKLLKIKSKREFIRTYKVPPALLNTIERNIQSDDVQENWKIWAKKLTPNVVKILYDKIKEEGDPQRINLWFKFVEEKKDNIEVSFVQSFNKIRERLSQNEYEE